MRLPQSSHAIRHHVSLFRFKQRLQRPLENLMGQCPPSRRPELADNRRAEKFPISKVTSQDLNERPVGFLIGDAGTVSPKYKH